MQSVNPATEELIATYDAYGADEIERRLANAQRGFLQWHACGIEERSRLLMSAAKQLRQNSQNYASLITTEMGKPITEARSEVEKCAWVCEFYAQHGDSMLAPESVDTDATQSLVRFDPLGAILGAMPWNFPFWQVFRFAAPTLMAGNVALLKHAANVCGCALAIEELFAAAGFPAGVFTALLVGHDAVEKIIDDARVAGVSLTGSVAAGKRIGAWAGHALKPTVLELGGSDPFIVLHDADLEAAAKGAVLGRNINAGQSCIAAKRFIVEAAVYDDFLERFKHGLEDLTVGDPMDPSVTTGPLARADLRDDLHALVQSSIRAGAQCRLGGEPESRQGYYYPPTLLTQVTPGMAVFDEETFGPVAAVVRATNTEEAIRLANHSRFGLGASLWTQMERGVELAPAIEAGHVAINGIVKSDPRLPFGGVKQSGIGRELGRHGLLAFVNVKAVWAAR